MSTARTFSVGAATGRLAWVGSSVVSGGAVTTMSISGLDLDTDRHYLIRVDLKPALPATSSTLSLYVNSDTTATNYEAQVLQLSNSTFANSRVNASTISAMASSSSNGRSVLWMELSRSATGYVIATIRGQEDNGGTLKMRRAEWQWLTLATNVTGVTMSSSAASSLDNDSRIDVWKITRP
jgi:hypothetical protein